MKNYANPLDNVKIASPCSANWNEMFGDERKRFCAECKLNVYNLSDMTQSEAENFLINSEGRVCIKFYRRADGTVLTKDCPVGWARVKRKISRTATAAFALIAGFFGGKMVFNQTIADNSDLTGKAIPVFEVPKQFGLEPIAGGISNLEAVKTQIKKTKSKKNQEMVLGRVVNVRQLKDEPVILWIK